MADRNASINAAEARRALDTVGQRRRQIVDEINVPAWYWCGLAAAWVGLGLVAAFGAPWLSVLATVAFGAAHAAVAPRVIDGRHGSRRLTVRQDVVSRRTSALVIGFLLLLVATTVAIALLADALHAPQPALIASVIVAVAVLLGGPRLLASVRRHAEQSARR